MIKFFIYVIAVILFSSCASVKVHHENGKKEGLKIYMPKPYILVARAGEGGKFISVNTVMLPDQSDPHIISHRAGLGTAEVKIEIAGGVLKTFGAVVDSKIPETLKEVGGLITGYGALSKALSEAGKLDEEADSLRRESADEADIQEAIEKIGQALLWIGALAGKNISQPEKDEISIIKAHLDEINKKLKDADFDKDPAVLDQFSSQLKEVTEQIKKAAVNYPVDVLNAVPMNSIVAFLNIAADKIATKKVIVFPVFELYEVINKTGTTILNKVGLP